jgi:sensor domain CHASE-containing protein
MRALAEVEEKHRPSGVVSGVADWDSVVSICHKNAFRQKQQVALRPSTAGRIADCKPR